MDLVTVEERLVGSKQVILPEQDTGMFQSRAILLG
jgi:hypothetical protein